MTLGEISGDRAWVAVPWDSRGVLTIAFETHEGRWLARHTHFSLSPAPA